LSHRRDSALVRHAIDQPKIATIAFTFYAKFATKITVTSMTTKAFNYLFFCAIYVVTAASANATSITVPNSSFELPSLPNGSNNNGGNGNTTAITNWTISAPAANTDNGVYHPLAGFTSTNPLPAPADGNQIAYLVPGAGNTSSITTSASLGAIASNMLYTLTVAVGNRSDNLFFDTGTYKIDILANGVSVGESTLSGSSVPHGTFTDLSATFTSPASGPLIGEALTIQLSAIGGSANDEAIFDNVRLTATPVPEPTTIALLFGGGAGVIGPAIRRRKRRS
jgi:hapalindole H/12-epi-hapalindole U/12-epi-fischerindole U synthase